MECWDILLSEYIKYFHIPLIFWKILSMAHRAKKMWKVEKVTFWAKSQKLIKKNGGKSLFCCMNRYSTILIALASQNGLTFDCRCCRGKIVDKLVSWNFHVFMKKKTFTSAARLAQWRTPTSTQPVNPGSSPHSGTRTHTHQRVWNNFGLCKCPWTPHTYVLLRRGVV